MKNKLIILSLLLAGSVAVSAQTKEKFHSEKCGDNIFISIGGGAGTFLNSENNENLGKSIAPLVTFSLGKWSTPIWGVRGQVAGWEGYLNTNQNGGPINGAGNPEFGPVVKYEKKYISAQLDALLGLSHWWGGYRPDRLFNVSAFFGPGFTFAKGYGSAAIVRNAADTEWSRVVDLGKTKALINGSVGLLGQFNVSKYIDINLEARGGISSTIFGKYNPAHTDGSVGVTAGLTYTFGGKKFVPNTKVVETIDNSEQYRKLLAEKEAELAEARRALANVKPVTKEVVKEVEVAGPRAIFFQINKAVIDDYGMVNIQLAAKIIKANPNKKYTIAGYADKATGSASVNQKLSDQRAKVVYDALVKEGVSPSQLEYKGYGGVNNMFGKDKLNRVIILE